MKKILDFTVKENRRLNADNFLLVLHSIEDVYKRQLANWTSGGENSLSLLSNIRYFWNYNRNNTSWENWVHYRFGFMKNGDEDIRKNEDRFELNSKLGQRAFKHWYYTCLLYTSMAGLWYTSSST